MTEEIKQDKQDDSKPERNDKGQLLPGNTANPNGRPKGKTLKEYARDFYMLKTDEEKKEYIEELEKKMPGFSWRMAEGNPATQTDITSGGEKVVTTFNFKPNVTDTTDDKSDKEADTGMGDTKGQDN